MLEAWRGPGGLALTGLGTESLPASLKSCHQCGTVWQGLKANLESGLPLPGNKPDHWVLPAAACAAGRLACSANMSQKEAASVHSKVSQQRPCSSWGLPGAVLTQNEIGSLFLNEAKILHVEKREENLPRMTENALGRAGCICFNFRSLQTEINRDRNKQPACL